MNIYIYICKYINRTYWFAKPGEVRGVEHLPSTKGLEGAEEPIV